MRYKTLSAPKKWIIKGIPVLFLIGSGLHYLYDLTGGLVVAGLLSPVSESIWEHMKLVLLPIILWWTIYYYVKGDEYKISRNKWFGGALASLLTALATVPLLFYFYTGAFGFESLLVDVSLLFFAVLFGQLLGLHCYRFGKGIRPAKAILIFVIIWVLFAAFTFFPPELPIFQYEPM